jgi:methylmalonyl-CoA/ethylmalonyl-CoA epimerase
MIDRIDHLGIAVHKLEDAIPLYEKALGLKCERIEEIPSQKVRTAFFAVGETHVELLEPTAEDSAVAKFLASRGEGVHHVAFHASDLEAQMQRAADAGVRLVDETPKIGAGGKQIAFLHPKSTRGVMVELCRGGEEHG